MSVCGTKITCLYLNEYVSLKKLIKNLLVFLFLFNLNLYNTQVVNKYFTKHICSFTLWLGHTLKNELPNNSDTLEDD